jgi:DNA repair protein SbcC/Rad50
LEGNTIIKRLEIKNFENHFCTVLEDLSDGFNLLCGESNSGKTSIVRAISLVAYNEFDQRSVRLGAKNCEVTITTERGTVNVIRGKDHIWNVTKNGCETETFTNPGKMILPEAAEIIGLKVVKLGDAEIKVNVMDQLEGHFMMAELEGEAASGSARAQIIDEISGLTGIETVIRDVSLDNTRTAKEIKKLEEDNKVTKTKLHDPTVIATEQTVVDGVKGLLKKVKDSQKQIEAMEATSLAVDLVDQKIVDTKNKLKGLKDTFDIEEKLDKIVGKVGDLADAKKLKNDYQGVVDEEKDIQDKVKELPDTDKLEKRLQKQEDNLSDISDMNDLQEAYNSQETSIADLDVKIQNSETELEGKKKELKEILDQIDLCPICLEPVHDGCKQHVEASV